MAKSKLRRFVLSADDTDGSDFVLPSEARLTVRELISNVIPRFMRLMANINPPQRDAPLNVAATATATTSASEEAQAQPNNVPCLDETDSDSDEIPSLLDIMSASSEEYSEDENLSEELYGATSSDETSQSDDPINQLERLVSCILCHCKPLLQHIT